jgi:Reverse transcriptase (RNA-dependent DNA polymerase)
VLYQNVRGLNSKTLECLSSVLAQEHDVVALTETWLSDSVKNAELFDERYLVFRRDRGSRGGGVLLAVRADRVLSARPLEYLNTVGEHLWINIELPRTSIIICVAYFPPNQCRDISKAFFSKIESELPYLMGKKIVMMGDFNLTSLPYLAGDVSLMADSLGMSNFNNVTNCKGSKLDLIFTSFNPNLCNVSRSGFVLVAEDGYHPALELVIELSYPTSSVQSDPESTCISDGWIFGNVLDNRNCNILLDSLSSCDWRRVYECADVNTAVDHFYELIYDVFNCIFRKKKSFTRNRAYPKWFDKNLISILRKKHKFHKLWKRFKDQSLYDNFSSLRAQAKSIITSRHAYYSQECGNQILRDPQKFWNFIGSKKVNNPRLSVMSNDNKTFVGFGDIADGFAEYFKSVFDNNVSDDSNLSSSHTPWSYTLNIDELSISDLKYGFGRLKSISSSGPDFIPDFILKGCESCLLNPLKFIFNLILKSSVFPDRWKCTKVTPVYKKGDKSCIKNYRPVALLSSPAKLFEIIVQRHIYFHSKQLLVEQQHGFRPFRSTITNLLCFSNFVSNHLDAGVQVDVIYTDFEKAFDRVNHKILLSKLYDIGFSLKLIKLFASYLQARRQYVTYGHSSSDSYLTNSGVPQGSNLGPLLFNLFINDVLSACRHSKFLMYADDLKLFRAIKTSSDCHFLQEDLDSLVKWATVNRLPLSIGKCQVVSYSRSYTPLLHSYNIGESNLIRVSYTKDLGVTFEAGWRFDRHIADICNRSSRMLGFVMRNARHFNNLFVLRVLYGALVRSILESGSEIWCPSEAKYCLLIERVQKKFLRHLYLREYGFYPFLYPSAFLLGMLGYRSLETRRKVCLIKHFSGLLKGRVDNPGILEELRLWVPEHSHESRARSLFLPVRARTCMLVNSPVSRAITFLNQIARSVDLFTISDTNLSVFLDFFNL